MAGDPCKQPKQLNHKDMKPCVFHKHHDYFQGSELAYILGVMLIVLFPLIVLFCAYIAIKVLIIMAGSALPLVNLDPYFLEFHVTS